MKLALTRSKILFQLLAVSFALISATVFAVALQSIYQSRKAYEERARVAAENLSGLLAQNISGIVARIDLGLQATIDEIDRETLDGIYRKNDLNAFIGRQVARIQEFDSLRFADTEGIVRFGTGTESKKEISIADRDYFARLRNDDKVGLVVSKPLIGRFTGQWSIVFARRVSKPDGSFGGIVYGGFHLDRFEQMFGALSLGSKGVVSLRSPELAMITRHPMPADRAQGIGNVTVSQEFLDALERDPEQGSLIARTGVDGINRTAFYRRMTAYPAYIIVGLATEDYLGEWYEDVKKLIFAATLFFLISAFMAFLVRTALLRRNASEAHLRSIFDASPDALLISDERGIITMANQQIQNVLGYAVDEIIGQSIDTLVPADFRNRHKELRARLPQVYETQLMGRGREIQALRKDGSVCEVEIGLSQVRTDHGTFIASSLRDISDRKAAAEEIKYLAFYDPLTRLPNRRLLIDRLEHGLANCDRSQRLGALLFIDLDNFKTLNDTHGHAQGDQLLQQVAERLENCVRDNDTVARLGGDEFVIILEQLSGRIHEAAAQAETASEKIIRVLRAPYSLEHQEYQGTPSIGVTLFGMRNESVEDLLKQADLAMYQAKSAGRNTIRFFDPAMQTALAERSALEADLRLALERGQFSIAYQAQVDNQHRVLGAEALLRWQQPERGAVSPGDFIPIAEESGLILPIGKWVLHAVCLQIRRWADSPATRDLRVSVNVSARQFQQADFVTSIRQSIAETGADPTRLKIELTESMVLEDVGDTFAKMAALKAEGISFSLDDFGTGNSSLSYLTRLPLDQLKIDRSFVLNLPGNHNDAIIAQTIITMAKSLGLDVIAEGVETEAQKEFLSSHQCNAFQGYLFSRPLPLEAFEAFLAAGPQNRLAA